MARLTEPINLKKLAEDGIEFQIDASFVKEHECDSEDDEDLVDIRKRQLQYSNKECTGVFDEDVYEEGEPFEIIAKKMFNLIPNGKIKKRVIREGSGEKPLECATVKVNYNAYIEYDDQPFDSTYVRNRPFRFTIGAGRVIPGLDFAIQSMKLNEKSQFLIHPDYAYGKNCFIGPVPPDATVLFEVELFEVVNSGAAVTYEKLPEERQKMFSEIYKYCTALCEKGKRAFMDQDFKSAIKSYNTAAAKLDKAMLNDRDEVEKHRELAVKLHSNLLICYALTKGFRKGCLNAKKVYELTQNGELYKIPAKTYFNHAKCLRLLGDYETAKTVLNQAYQLEPNNPEIANEMINLNKDKQEHKKNEALLAQALFTTGIK